MKNFTLFTALLGFAAGALAQSPVWGQCGGTGWAGSTTCASGSTCTILNPYYSQCIPGTATVSSASSVPTSASSAVPPPPPPSGPSTTTSAAPAPTGSQIRAVNDPVFHFYLQNDAGQPVLGPEASSGYFAISGGTIQLTDGSGLYLNVQTDATTSYKPLTFDTSASTTDWQLEGDTIITNNPRELNFLACATSDANIFTIYLQYGNDQPSGESCSMQSLHLPCLC
ncbi:carbohydrate-binding module family 1 protein [Phanerochaete sordida]|uniref:Carbohydrate-binding module family 1 protein n=1 Tax=Phanerochaete sordida TaxID=48140 RepID=A0A9P3GCH4_9APHY|nr:carbohydrate-binding module family 1 protein [Phanerochaete sordida]